MALNTGNSSALIELELDQGAGLRIIPSFHRERQAAVTGLA
jgi:hypothetical protein